MNPQTTRPDAAHGPPTAEKGADGAHGPHVAADSTAAAHGPHVAADSAEGVDGEVWAEGVARFRAARLWVARNMPYYARVLFSCPVAFTDQVGTVSVNGHWRMKANPAFCAKLTDSQVAAVLVHELNHVLRDHHARSVRAGVPDAGFDLWKFASDCEINDDLRQENLDVPDGLLYPETLGLDPGRLAEQYYNDIVDLALEIAEDMADRACEHDHTRGPNTSNAEGGGGDVTGGDGGGEGGLSRARQEQLRRQTAQDIIDHCDNNGEWAAPAGLQQWAFKLVEPRVDWRRLLAAELRKGLHRRPGTGDATWDRPPRRPDDGPVLRPGTARPTAHIAVVVDTSGSMGDEDHARAIAETRQILSRAVPGESIRVYSADHRIIGAQTITQTRQISLPGGGGTDMGRAVTAAAQDRPQPAVIVVITDGHTPWPQHRPPTVAAKVIAVLTRPGTAHNVPRWITPIEAFVTVA